MTETIDPMTTTGLASLGWDDGWAPAFAPCAAARPAPAGPGRRRPSRDLRSSATAMATGRRPSRARSGSRRSPRRTSRPSATGCADSTSERRRSPPSCPRRTAFKRMAADASRLLSGASTTSRSWPRTSTSPCSSPASTTTSTCAGIERYLAVAWSSGSLPVVVLNKADLADDVDGRVVAVEADRPRRRRSSRSRPGPATRAGRPASPPAARAARPRSSARPASASPRCVNALLGEDRQATAAVRGSDSRGRHTTTHRELFELPGGALLVDTPGIRSLEVARRRGGPRGRLRRVAEIAARVPVQRLPPRGRARLRGAAAPSPTAGSTRIALASLRKLERELARVGPPGGPARPRGRAPSSWKLIHKSVNEHMDRKYGDDR